MDRPLTLFELKHQIDGLIEDGYGHDVLIDSENPECAVAGVHGQYDPVGPEKHSPLKHNMYIRFGEIK